MTAYLLVTCADYNILVPTANVERLTEASGVGPAAPPILDARVLIGADTAPARPIRPDRPAVIWCESGGGRRFAVLVDAAAEVLEIDDLRFEALPRLPRAVGSLFDRVLRAADDQPFQFRLKANLEMACAQRRRPLRLRAARVARAMLREMPASPDASPARSAR